MTLIAFRAFRAFRPLARPPAAPPLTPPSRTRLPDGFTVELADDVHRSRDGRLLFGGSSPRLLRMTTAAARLLDRGRFDVTGPATAGLARRLLDVGAAHPRPVPAPVADTTVVVPAKDRADQVGQLLARLRADPQTAGLPVLVVDDGSRAPAALAAAARRHGATLLVHPRNLGPAAARNTGLRHATSRYVAFCDSDVLPERGWIAPLLAQFADPAVALAAPRVVSVEVTVPGLLDRYEQVRSPLDMGPREAPVVPLSALAYVPSAVMVVRREAVGAGFAPELRIAEDVDLCLRLHAAGWRLRYVPQSRVGHRHRTGLHAWLAQRESYGTGAAELALRHPGLVPPLHAGAWTLAAWALLLRGTGRSVGLAGLVTALAAARLARRMPDADAPVRAGSLLALAALRGTGEQLARCATRHHWPLAVLAAAVSRRARRVLVAAAVVEGLIDHHRSAGHVGGLSAPAHLAVRRLDDLAYGWGVWHGALRRRTLAPLRPRLARASRAPASRHQPSTNLAPPQ